MPSTPGACRASSTRGKVTVVGVHEFDAMGRTPASRERRLGERTAITVQPNEARRAAVEQCGGVPAEADGAVHEAAAPARAAVRRAPRGP